MVINEEESGKKKIKSILNWQNQSHKAIQNTP
jgi:hypothetical protein